MTKLSAHQPYSSCKVLVIKKNPTIHIIYTNVQILIKLKCNFKTIALISFKLELLHENYRICNQIQTRANDLLITSLEN